MFIECIQLYDKEEVNQQSKQENNNLFDSPVEFHFKHRFIKKKIPSKIYNVTISFNLLIVMPQLYFTHIKIQNRKKIIR